MNNLNTIQRITSELTKIFDALNDHYFESSLPPVVITITPGKSKATSFYGRFTAESWAEIKDVNVNEENGQTEVEKGEVYNEIAIAPEYFTRPFDAMCATLCHEMVHLYCYVNNIEDTSNGNRYHNKRFRHYAEEAGLIIDKAPVIGWSVTTPSSEFSDFVDNLEIDRDVFKMYRDTQLGVSAKAPKKRYVCPVCGQQAQAKKESNVVCGECMKRTDYWELNNMELIEDYNGGLYKDSDWYKEMMDDMDY